METAPRTSDRRRGPQPYDFRRPTALSRDHLRVANLVAESYARQLGSLFTATLNVSCDVQTGLLEQLTFDEATRRLDAPLLLAVVESQLTAAGGATPPSTGTGLLALDNQLAMLAVDRLLGGDGSGEQPQRAVTELEIAVLNLVLDRALVELVRAFEPVAAATAVRVAVETNAQFAQVLAPSDAVLSMTFEVALEDAGGSVSLCLPTATLAPALDAAVRRGRRATDDADDAVGDAIGERLLSVPVEVAVRFAPLSLSAREVLDLAPGDVLPLPHPTTRPLSVVAEDVPYAVGVVGRSGTRAAVRIIAPTRGTGTSPSFEETA